jgi:hypothetical protein
MARKTHRIASGAGRDARLSAGRLPSSAGWGVASCSDEIRPTRDRVATSDSDGIARSDFRDSA